MKATVPDHTTTRSLLTKFIQTYGCTCSGGPADKCLTCIARKHLNITNKLPTVSGRVEVRFRGKWVELDAISEAIVNNRSTEMSFAEHVPAIRVVPVIKSKKKK